MFFYDDSTNFKKILQINNKNGLLHFLDMDTIYSTNSIDDEILNSKNRIKSIFLAHRKRDLKFNLYIQLVENHSNIVKKKYQEVSKRINDCLKNEIRSIEACMLKHILLYFRILKYELNTNSAQLIRDAVSSKIMEENAKILNNIKIFNMYMKLETNCKVSLLHVREKSAQHERCIKALHDNMNLRLWKREGFDGFTMNFVFKLEQGALSSRFKESVKQEENGKIKGLFCSLSNEQFYAFVAYGVCAQKKCSTGIEKNDLRGIFTQSWLCNMSNNEFSSSSMRDKMVSNRGTSTSTFCLKALHMTQTNYGHARNLVNESLKTFNEHLQFSRFSNNTMNSKLDGQIDSGSGFVALCRVLIRKLRTVRGVASLSQSVLEETAQLGYDAIYNETTEQYVFLKGEFVLPEFMMHVRYHKRSEGDVPATSALHSYVRTTNPNLVLTEGITELSNDHPISCADLLARNALSKTHLANSSPCDGWSDGNSRQNQLTQKISILTGLEKSIKSFSSRKNDLLKKLLLQEEEFK